MSEPRTAAGRALLTNNVARLFPFVPGELVNAILAIEAEAAERHYPGDNCGDPEHDAILEAWYAKAEALLDRDPTVEELQVRQHVGPITSLEAIQDTSITDEEAAAFLEAMEH